MQTCSTSRHGGVGGGEGGEWGGQGRGLGSN